MQSVPIFFSTLKRHKKYESGIQKQNSLFLSMLTISCWVSFTNVFLSFQGRKVLERVANLSITRGVVSIELFLALCFKVVTSPLVMEEVGNLYMERSLPMRISRSSILGQVAGLFSFLVSFCLLSKSSEIISATWQGFIKTKLQIK